MHASFPVDRRKMLLLYDIAISSYTKLIRAFYCIKYPSPPLIPAAAIVLYFSSSTRLVCALLIIVFPPPPSPS